ncbi:hypothetical protein HYC85_006277 [Camellia sinensis]|uniref:Uncharacterized protein n=1 Tax=Camellia sinensis TaxID=4442 RepID=A0A7J7HMG9_CAMSI|nr:hypothetical protein HYC85_006277 [Camellia sinensis]
MMPRIEHWTPMSVRLGVTIHALKFQDLCIHSLATTTLWPHFTVTTISPSSSPLSTKPINHKQFSSLSLSLSLSLSVENPIHCSYGWWDCSNSNAKKPFSIAR